MRAARTGWVASGTTIISVRPSTLQNTRELTPFAFGWLPGIVLPALAPVQKNMVKKEAVSCIIFCCTTATNA